MPERTLPSQDKRALRVKTPAVPDAFLLTGFSGEEPVNGLFEFTLDLVSDDNAITASSLVGTSVTFGVVEGLTPQDGIEPRWWNGIVRSFGGGEVAGQNLYAYRMVVVPKLWLTSLRKRSRVFENAKVGDVISQVLNEYGIRPTLKGTLDPQVLKIITQFQESDLDLVARLVAAGGGCWYHTHADGAHGLVIGVGTTAFGAVAGQDPSLALSDTVVMKQGVPSKITLHDWSMKRDRALSGNAEPRGNHAGTLPEQALYQVGMRNEEDGLDLTKIANRRMETAIWQANRMQASSNCPRLSPGLKFAGSEYTPRIDGQAPAGLTVAHARHAASDRTFVVDGGYASYRNVVTLVPDDLPLTSPPAPRPAVYGLHTATISDGWAEGASGDPDKIGRVRIKYHWGANNGTDPQSTWARVSQQWVGPSSGYGSIWTPPVDTEVLVAFLDGDPDRPIVVGCLYNGVDKIPSQIGDDHAKTRNGVVTKSGHEFWFDDKSGSEKVRLFSKKDLEIEVKNNQTVTIHVDDTQTIKGKRTETVTNDMTLTVESGNYKRTISSGDAGLKAGAGAITEEAAQKIEMKVGANSITIDTTGITIKGTMVKIEGSAMFEAKAPMSTVKGDGMLTLKGGIVLIN